jgi:hypothetical protein
MLTYGQTTAFTTIQAVISMCLEERHRALATYTLTRFSSQQLLVARILLCRIVVHVKGLVLSLSDILALVVILVQFNLLQVVRQQVEGRQG